MNKLVELLKISDTLEDIEVEITKTELNNLLIEYEVPLEDYDFSKKEDVEKLIIEEYLDDNGIVLKKYICCDIYDCTVSCVEVKEDSVVINVTQEKDEETEMCYECKRESWYQELNYV